MQWLEDFKKFAFRGNVVDLAVGVVIGGAFGKIVTALVNDVIMPILSLLMPGGDWRSRSLVLRNAADPADKVALHYGEFLGATIDFFIISAVLFVLVRKVMKAITSQAQADQGPTKQVCGACRETNHPEASRCRACTSTLSGAAAS